MGDMAPERKQTAMSPSATLGFNDAWIWALIFLIGSKAFAVDNCLPAIPSIAQGLGQTVEAAQLTFTEK